MSTAAPLQTVHPDSLTCSALRSAHLRGMQARRLYAACAQRMEKSGLAVIAHALRFTAAQEKEHAAIFAGLAAAYGRETDPLPEKPLPHIPDDPAALMLALSAAEADAADEFLPAHARTAAAEGFPRAAQTFLRIADTEKRHARRFRQYAQALQSGTLFRDEASVSWICLPCGELHTGREAPIRCAGCGRGQGGFIRSSYHPFGVKG